MIRMELDTLLRTENLELVQSEAEGITIITIKGNVYRGKTPIHDIMSGILDRHGISCCERERNPFRHIPAGFIECVINHGTERDQSSFRHVIFEQDFYLGSSDYTFCHYFVNRDRHIADISDMFITLSDQSIATVFYIGELMQQHINPKYVNGTGTLFSFRDLSNKRAAVRLILCHEGACYPLLPSQELGRKLFTKG